MSNRTIKRKFASNFQDLATGQYASTGTGWENTGVSITVPSGSIALVMGATGWNTGKPKGLKFVSSGNLSGGMANGLTYSDTEAIYASNACLLPPNTWYLFAIRGGASETPNNYAIFGTILDLNGDES